MLDDPILYERLRFLEQRVAALEKMIDELKKEVELGDSEQHNGSS